MANVPKICDCLKDTNDFLDKLNRNRKDKFLTDFHVQSGQHSAPCHKIVLTSRTGLSSDDIERDVLLKFEFDVPSDALDAVLQFIYTLQVEVTEDNVFHLYQLSKKLCVESLYQFCLDFINNLVVTDLNWATLCHYQEKLRPGTLRQNVAIHLASNFDKMQHNELLMHIPNDFLQVVLSRDDLKVSDETEVFYFIQKWIQHETHRTGMASGDSEYSMIGNVLLESHCFMEKRLVKKVKDNQNQLGENDGTNKEDERIVFAPELLRLVRLPMSSEIVQDLDQLRRESEFQSPECVQLFDTAMKYYTFPSMRWSLQSSMTRPRPSTGWKETLIAVSPHGPELASLWDEAKQQWLACPSEQPPSVQFSRSLSPQSISVVNHDNKFFVIDTEHASVHVCDNIISNIWRQISSSFEKRVGAACVIVDDNIFVVGGKHNCQLTKTVDGMDIPKQMWMPVKGDFQEYIPVSFPCLFSLPGKMYVFGGFDENDKKVRHAQVFDRRRGKWSITKDLFPADFTATTAACYEGVVYVLCESGKMVAVNVGSLELTPSADFGLDCAFASMTIYQKHAVAVQPEGKKLLYDPETTKTKELPSHIDAGKRVYLFTLPLPCKYTPPPPPLSPPAVEQPFEPDLKIKTRALTEQEKNLIKEWEGAKFEAYKDSTKTRGFWGIFRSREESSRTGATVLHFVSENGQIDVVRALLTRGDNVNKPSSSDGSTPLHLASYFGKTDVVTLLIQNGADIHSKDNNGRTPLHTASRYGKTDVVTLLIQNGADVNAKDKNGYTPLHSASANGEAQAAEVLIKAGATVNAKDNNGGTPLHTASNWGQAGTVEVLIKAGADINAKTDKEYAGLPAGSTPLHTASYRGKSETAEVLIKAGATVNAKDNDGETPLHRASKMGKTDIVTLLIQNGADVNHKSNAGNTPLHLASENAQHCAGCKDVISLLLRNNADKNNKNSSGQTPKDVASTDEARRLFDE